MIVLLFQFEIKIPVEENQSDQSEAVLGKIGSEFCLIAVYEINLHNMRWKVDEIHRFVLAEMFKAQKCNFFAPEHYFSRIEGSLQNGSSLSMLFSLFEQVMSCSHIRSSAIILGCVKLFKTKVVKINQDSFFWNIYGEPDVTIAHIIQAILKALPVSFNDKRSF
jgi:hypothetical protein